MALSLSLILGRCEFLEEVLIFKTEAEAFLIFRHFALHLGDVLVQLLDFAHLVVGEREKGREGEKEREGEGGERERGRRREKEREGGEREREREEV